MQWAEVNGNEWLIPAHRTKSNREHLIFLPDSVAACIEDRKNRGFEEIITVTSSSVRQALKRIAKKQGMTHFSNHDLRRTSSTLLAKEGIDQDTRARMLNHSIGGTTERHYTSYNFQAEKHAAALKLWAVLERTGIL
jgi:integrase